MARPSPAALDVMEHIAEAMDRLDHIMVSIQHLADHDIVEEVARVRDELQQARRTGAEVLLELLNLSERHALMQDELEEFRRRVH
jgi:predicted  nucleic acid-binding Zn-ribbon protein